MRLEINDIARLTTRKKSIDSENLKERLEELAITVKAIRRIINKESPLRYEDLVKELSDLGWTGSLQNIFDAVEFLIAHNVLSIQALAQQPGNIIKLEFGIAESKHLIH